MNIERLVAMANDIAAFWDADKDKAAAAENVATHMKKFWDPRMRREIVAHLLEGGAGMSDLSRSAVRLLEAQLAAKQSHS